MTNPTISFKFIGARPIILHNGDLANPLSPSSKALSALTSKKKKTDADHVRIAETEFKGALYIRDGVIIVPSTNLEACIIEGARVNRQGKDVAAGLIVPDDAVLEYDGPPADKLFGNERFMLQRAVRIGQKRVIRTRPRIPGWSLAFTAKFDPEVVNRAQIIDAAVMAGKRCALGSWRPRYGRFTVEVDD